MKYKKLQKTRFHNPQPSKNIYLLYYIMRAFFIQIIYIFYKKRGHIQFYCKLKERLNGSEEHELELSELWSLWQ